MNEEKERLARRRGTFVNDARRRLETLGASLLALERDPTDHAALDDARRALHTLKGNAGMVGLETFAATAHALEGALTGPLTPATLALLTRGLDALNAMVALLAELSEQPGLSIPVVAALEALRPTASSVPAGKNPPPESTSPPLVTVPVGHLDALLELVTELRVTQSDLANAPVRETQERLLARQRRLLHELHNTVLATRLLPVAQAFNGFERLVWDLAASTGRRARLTIEGAETEIDRSALQPVRELLVHLLRNALVHGIEPPEERLAADKPAEGQIRLAAHPDRDGVTITVADDGRGLNRAQVAARAVAQGLCTAEEAATMEDARLWMFLTRPGFSARVSADALSGRGVGLSAVRQGIEALRGRLEIASQPGLGTTVRLWLPSQMALEELVLVNVGSETYAISQSVVERACRPQQADDLPILDLRERLQVPGAISSEGVLLVCRRSGGQVGLRVDEVAGHDEAVIQPLPRRAREPGFLGALITGSGQVVLVLDLERL